MEGQALPVYGLYSARREGLDDLCLVGSPEGFTSFADVLQRARGEDTWHLQAPPPEEIAPYDCALTAATIVLDSQTAGVRISKQGDILRIVGPEDALGVLADNLCQFEVWQREGRLPPHAHQHLEHWPGHPFLTPDSNTLVAMIGATETAPG